MANLYSHAVIRYRNHRGEASDRTIVPLRIHFGVSPWHPTPQWLLEAHDLDKDALRSFAMVDILNWRSDPYTPPPPIADAAAAHG